MSERNIKIWKPVYVRMRISCTKATYKHIVKQLTQQNKVDNNFSNIVVLIKFVIFVVIIINVAMALKLHATLSLACTY